MEVDIKRWTLGIGCLLVIVSVFADGNARYQQGEAAFAADPAKACELFVQAAEEGNISAMAGAGYCLETGTGTTNDYAKAIEWYEKAVAQNSLKACEGLARIYASCPDPEFHDGEKAVKYATPVARKKPRDADALGLLAAAHARNIEFEKAISVSSKARFMATSDQLVLLKVQEQGYQRGMPQPAKATDAWIEEAAQQEKSWPVIEWARLCASRKELRTDVDTVLKFYEMAAAMGAGEFYILIADLYYKGDGMDVNLLLAMENYRLARKDESTIWIRNSYPMKDCDQLQRAGESCFKLGNTMKDGLEYSVQAEHKHITGTNPSTGKPMYEMETRRAPPDLVRAWYLYEVASKKEHIEAMKALVELYNAGGSSYDPEASSYEEAMSWYNTLVKRNVDMTGVKKPTKKR